MLRMAAAASQLLSASDLGAARFAVFIFRLCTRFQASLTQVQDLKICR